jgi:hypothetical protein
MMVACPLILVARRILFGDDLEFVIMGIFGSLALGSALWHLGNR